MSQQYQPGPTPGYQPGGQAPGSMVCPKCRGTMLTFNRNGVHVEQCGSCRGVFLDFGELEHLIQMESRYAAPAPPPQAGHYGPEWGHHGNKHYKKKGFGGLFFSS